MIGDTEIMRNIYEQLVSEWDIASEREREREREKESIGKR